MSMFTVYFLSMLTLAATTNLFAQVIAILVLNGSNLKI